MPDSSAASSQTKKTALHALHLQLGAKMVAFGGYQLPVSYKSGIIKEHLHTRQYASLFDISHMGQIKLSGQQAGVELEKLVPANIQGLHNNQQRYTVFTNQQGGILDDLMISHMGDHWMLVVNAACKHNDYRYLCEQLPDSCSAVLLENQSLLALQGPFAASILNSTISDGSADIPFMTTSHVLIDEIPCQISRSGYTGEDGYEISLASNQAVALAQLLLEQDDVMPAGLGARDTLRLEAGLCLYGHDIDMTTTPVEAGLSWVIDRDYMKPEPKTPLFPGAQIILEQIKAGPSRQRVGLLPLGRAPVREGAELLNQHNENIGVVTSGGFGPSVGAPVAMGYVDSDSSVIGTQLIAKTKGRELPVKVTNLPFVAHHYHCSE
ncbi:MAG TPA: glycine cleavage system aminomethyltransferase GcvT [Crenotrichaceae bacterium]|nr:glycine cleavage system aminomethyltransferase GcvT [Crenotrichaceae bacterium]